MLSERSQISNITWFQLHETLENAKLIYISFTSVVTWGQGQKEDWLQKAQVNYGDKNILYLDCGSGCAASIKTRHPASVAQLVGASSRRPKDCGFNSQSGHMTRLQVQSPVGVCTKRQPITVFLSHWCFPLSSLSPPTTLSNSNEKKKVLKWG